MLCRFVARLIVFLFFSLLLFTYNLIFIVSFGYRINKMVVAVHLPAAMVVVLIVVVAQDEGAMSEAVVTWVLPEHPWVADEVGNATF